MYMSIAFFVISKPDMSQSNCFQIMGCILLYETDGVVYYGAGKL